MDAEEMLSAIRAYPSFLMVGAIKPRKDHALILDTFERFWHEGLEINLDIVGKQDAIPKDPIQ